MKMRKPRFKEARGRPAASRAIDRRALVQAVHQGGAVVGASMAPKPHGFWGLLDRDLNALPGYGKPADEKPRAKQLLAEAGVTPQNPLRVEMVTRAIAVYVDMASFVINELKQIGIEASLKQIETAQWHATATRGDYQIGANLTGIGPDDPDANYFENYACGSPRNYSFYCDEQVMKMMEKQAILRELGMDRPYWIQYLDWMRQILTGDLGKSYRYDVPAWEVIRPLVPVTIELAVLSIIVAVVLGVPTGVISAVRQDTTLDYVLRVLSLAGLSMPSFWLGMVIILGMVSWLGWIPPLTYVKPTENFRAHAIQFV